MILGDKPNRQRLLSRPASPFQVLRQGEEPWGTSPGQTVSRPERSPSRSSLAGREAFFSPLSSL